MKPIVLAIIIASLSGCCIFQGPPEPEIRYVDRKEYILPDLPDEILQPVDVPRKRVWTVNNLQGEVGEYILELNTNLGEANNKINGIREYLDKLEVDIKDVHNPSED